MDRRFTYLQEKYPYTTLGDILKDNGNRTGIRYERYVKWWYGPVYWIGRKCENILFQRFPNRRRLIYFFRHYINLD